MPVPPADIVCRFIRPADWSAQKNTPRAGAFKQSRQADLSVWHPGRLAEHQAALADLQIGPFAGSGQAHHTAGDYVRLALKAAELEEVSIEIQIQVEWRPEDAYVPEPWRQWRYAHVQVEGISGPPGFLHEYRNQLTLNCRALTPPA